MSIRPGRFSFDVTEIDDGSTNARGNAQLIARGRTDSYRVMNSGKFPFEVRRARDGAGLTVFPRCSVDLKVTNFLWIYAAKPNSGADPFVVEGIYDYLAPSRAVRAGRFNLTNQSPAPTSPVTLSFQQGQSRFRIFNSHHSPIVVQQGIGRADVSIKPRQSVDLIAGLNMQLQTLDAEGIIQNLLLDSDVRSGHFKLEPSSGDQLILDTYNAPGSAWYRIFNSSDNTIVIKANEGGTAKPSFDLAASQSIDIEVGAETTVHVAAKVAAQRVEGIVDLIAVD